MDQPAKQPIMLVNRINIEPKQGGFLHFFLPEFIISRKLLQKHGRVLSFFRAVLHRSALKSQVLSPLFFDKYSHYACIFNS